MEVHVDRDAFSRGLQMVQNIVEPRQTLPILANILLHAEGEALTVTATDLEVGARVSMPAKVLGPGAITLPARKLGEIVKELPSMPLAFRVQENAWVAIRCAGAAYRLVGLSPEDFPPVTEGTTSAWVRLDGKVFRDMLAQTSFAMSHDESRYALNGVLLVLGDTEVRVVATDGHRLALATRAVASGGVHATGIVPRKAVHEVERILGAGEDVHIAISENQFLLRMPNVLVVARLIEGTFPNFDQVIPRGHPHRLAVGRDALSAALRRVSVLSEERTRPVKLTMGQGVLRMSAYHPDFGEAEESIEVDYQAEEVSIGFNSRYLLDALGAQGTEQAMFEFKDGLSPGVIRSREDEGSICVIMPMRI